MHLPTDTSASVEYLDHIAVRDTARSSIIGVDPDTRRLQLLQPHILVVDAVAAPAAVITDQLQRINAAVGIVRPFFNGGVSGNATQLLRMQIVDGFAEYLDLSARRVKRLAVFNVRGIPLYRVHSSAITKGRNSPDPNIADLICARRTQWRLERRIP